ncbi:MAG: transcription termination factor NusA [Candidatus Nealsonbacteria bacterium]|nr:transcription termination factor NusA [Candidatus Nealsonbacteria bacterium]
MDLKNFTSAVTQLAEEKDIPKKKVFEIIEQAIAAAYKKEYGERGQIIKAKLDPKSGELTFWQVKMAIDDSMVLLDEEAEELRIKKEEGEIEEDEDSKKVKFNPERHIMIEDARKIKEDVQLEEEVDIELEEKADYGRIAAQTAKQVVLQKIKEAEREMVLDEYKSKEGEILPGIVQRMEGPNVFIDIGKTLGVLSREEQVPNEQYRIGQRLKVYLLKVEETPKGPVVFLSRSYPRIIVKLFELEAPEVSSGSVEIKAIAREAGNRSKVAVYSETEGIDPIGAVVGQKGTRVSAVISELNGEKIDIVEYSAVPEKFITNALAPAKVVEVKVLEKNRALAIVPDDQLSLAIGKDGQNVRLAAKLTGWKIDVKGLEGNEAEDLEEDEEDES